MSTCCDTAVALTELFVFPDVVTDGGDQQIGRHQTDNKNYRFTQNGSSSSVMTA